MKRYTFKIWTSGASRAKHLINILADCIEQAWGKLMAELKTWKPELLSSALRMELHDVIPIS